MHVRAPSAPCRARIRAWRFSAASPSSPPRASWAPTTPSIGISRKSTPRFTLTSRASSRVPSDENRDGIETVWIRSAPRASAAIAAVRAGSIPPGDAEYDVAEPVLRDVVAQPETGQGASARAPARTARRSPAPTTTSAACRSRSSPPPAARGRPREVAAASRSRRPITSVRSTSTTAAPPRTRARGRSLRPRRRARPSGRRTGSSWPPTRLQNAT